MLDVVRLTPEQPDQGPLTVTFTQFPGLDVRVGRWHRELYPWCGCDQCDDDPSELLAAFNAMVRDLAEGHLVEELRRGLFSSRLSYRTPMRRGGRHSTGTRPKQWARAFDWTGHHGHDAIVARSQSEPFPSGPNGAEKRSILPVTARTEKCAVAVTVGHPAREDWGERAVPSRACARYASSSCSLSPLR